MMNKIVDIDELKSFFDTMKYHKIHKCYYFSDLSKWNVSRNLPSHDFNREIVEPGIAKVFPEGALGIRVDDNFWSVAILPYKFKELSIQDIVSVLWSDVKDPEFNPDYIAESEDFKDDHRDV